MAGSKPSHVLVIILNYNVYKDALECVASVRASTCGAVSILVIDNGSTDDSVSVLSRQLPKGVAFLKNQNTGYAGGNNLGLRWGLKHGADYFFILNPDTRVKPDTIEKLVHFAQSAGPEVGFMGPRIFHPSQPPTIYSNGGHIHWSLTKATLRDHGRYAKDLELTKDPFVTEYVTGTALFLSRTTLHKVGLMREDYFLYYEDTDWSLRCRKLGFKLFIVPAAVIYHEESKSTGLKSPRYIYYNTRNGLYLAWRHGNWWQKTYALLSSVIKMSKQPIKYLLIPKQRSWIKPVSRAIWDFWLGRTGPVINL